MPFVLACDSCGAKLRTPTAPPVGRKVNCPKCGAAFAVTAENCQEAPAPKPAASAWEVVEEKPAPKRARVADDEADERPKSKAKRRDADEDDEDHADERPKGKAKAGRDA